MDKTTFDYLIRKSDSRRSRRDSRDMRDYEDSRRMRRDYKDYEDGRRGRDSRDYRDYEDRRDYEDGRTHRGRGNVDFEGTMDFNDYNYDNRDSRDYSKSPKLSKTDIHHWKQMMRNEDGTRGPHYDMRQTMDAAEKIGVDFENDDFDEKEFCMAVNMMYSDYCKVVKKYTSPDKELMFFAELAKAFLDDEDGPGASTKLALYFNCIVDA